MRDAVIRRLGPGDIVAARGLNALYADAFDETDRYAGAPPDENWLATLLARPDVVAIVAEVDSVVVGGATAYLLPKLERATTELYIYDIAVSQEWRRRGIATRLIRFLQGLAGETGASSVYVQADAEDGPAVALYTRLGSRADVYHFELLADRD